MLITPRELEREINHAKTRLLLMEEERDALKNELQMLKGNPDAVHKGAQAALSAIHQMMAMKEEMAVLQQRNELLEEKMERALIAVAHFTHRYNEDLQRTRDNKAGGIDLSLLPDYTHEINPNHPVTRELREQWHKLCALVMFRLGISEMQLTSADIERMANSGQANILVRTLGEVLTISLVSDQEAERLARQESGLR